MNYLGKRVLVTGADGFIGSHLVEMLINEGANVRALSYYNSFNYWGWLEEIENRHKVEIVSGDIRDYNYMYEITTQEVKEIPLTNTGKLCYLDQQLEINEFIQ